MMPTPTSTSALPIEKGRDYAAPNSSSDLGAERQLAADSTPWTVTSLRDDKASSNRFQGKGSNGDRCVLFVY
jgi:hypothetical protein